MFWFIIIFSFLFILILFFILKTKKLNNDVEQQLLLKQVVDTFEQFESGDFDEADLQSRLVLIFMLSKNPLHLASMVRVANHKYYKLSSDVASHVRSSRNK